MCGVTSIPVIENINAMTMFLMMCLYSEYILYEAAIHCYTFLVLASPRRLCACVLKRGVKCELERNVLSRPVAHRIVAIITKLERVYGDDG